MDAAKGVPLRAAVYAQGSDTPVLELKAEHIRYGKVPASAFAISPPADAKMVNVDGEKAAVVTYGQDLGGMVVIQQPAEPAAKTPPSDKRGGDRGGLQLPKVSINGATGEELDTALATMIRFQRGGVAYTVLGSVPPAAAQAAARGL